MISSGNLFHIILVQSQNVAYSAPFRVFGNRPRNFEPWSSDEDDTWADTPSPDFHTTPTGRHWSLSCIGRFFTVGLQRY
ncbi:hypothetical protein TNCV_4961441 [Trichonephila clavipes]|uniref:Uncharacterized protein n=1 Tax=Trichonephila clavipes TaxID=2585209 RepID=A0A8X6VNV1_TRICX|nr:hypothetical protein TNCV_4961441 [Trichonephila clavipes]